MSKLTDHVDQVYVINLDIASERRVRMSSIMLGLGVKYKRISAINGRTSRARIHYRKLMQHDMKAVKDGRLTIPGMACTMSHMAAIRHALQNRFNKVAIFEDDIILHRDFSNELDKMHGLKDWKMVYLGATDYEHYNAQPDNGFYHPSGAFGRFAYCVDASLFQELLDVWHRATVTGDSVLANIIQPKYKEHIYVFKPNIVIADVRHSFIRSAREQSVQAEKLGWDMSLYESL